MTHKKVFWWIKGLLFYEVGFNYMPSGEKVIIARFWKWGFEPQLKAQALALFFQQRQIRKEDCIVVPMYSQA